MIWRVIFFLLSAVCMCGAAYEAIWREDYQFATFLVVIAIYLDNQCNFAAMLERTR